MNKKILVESLAMDLKRVALGSYRGSKQMTERFKEEALKRSSELETLDLNLYLKNLIKNCRKSLNTPGNRLGEDALMFSTLFQNFALKKM